jgi:Core-2/I-Branching enzyme
VISRSAQGWKQVPSPPDRFLLLSYTSIASLRLRAGFEPQQLPEAYPFRVKIVFLVLSHRNSAQLVRLLTVLRQQLPDAPLVVHHDKYREELHLSQIAHLDDVHLLTSEAPISWGDFSLVDAYWRSIRWINDNLEFDWLVLLSGQDYPIKPLGQLRGYLASISVDAVIEAKPIGQLPNAPDRRDGRRRYFYQYRPATTTWLSRHLPTPIWDYLRKTSTPLVDGLNNIQPYIQVYKFPDNMPWRLGTRARTTPFTETNPCWCGSAWCGLSRRAAELLIATEQNSPELVRYYRKAIIPDESATATIICNAPELRVEQRQLHYVRWSRPKSGHPDVLGIADWPDIRKSDCFFARKFDMTRDSEVLDRLDELIQSGHSIGAK